MSPLEAALGDYLRLRRSLGHKLADTERHLVRFVAYLDAIGTDIVTVQASLGFVLDPDLDPASTIPLRRLTAVRGFARHLAATDSRTQVLPAGLVGYRARRRIPYLFTDDELAALVRSVRAGTPSRFRADTLETLIGLLAVTGLRIGEALTLDGGDIDWDAAVIRVRDSKFHKGRDVPVSTSTLAALSAYQRRRNRQPHARRTTRLFVSLAGTQIAYSNFCHTFRNAVASAGIGIDAPSRPRIHDLRHRFAVRTVLGWYRAGLDVEALLPRLSTYLGHREPRFTYVYLTATPELLGQAAARLEATQAART